MLPTRIKHRFLVCEVVSLINAMAMAYDPRGVLKLPILLVDDLWTRSSDEKLISDLFQKTSNNIKWQKTHEEMIFHRLNFILTFWKNVKAHSLLDLVSKQWKIDDVDIHTKLGKLLLTSMYHLIFFIIYTTLIQS